MAEIVLLEVAEAPEGLVDLRDARGLTDLLDRVDLIPAGCRVEVAELCEGKSEWTICLMVGKNIPAEYLCSAGLMLRSCRT